VCFNSTGPLRTLIHPHPLYTSHALVSLRLFSLLSPRIHLPVTPCIVSSFIYSLGLSVSTTFHPIHKELVFLGILSLFPRAIVYRQIFPSLDIYFASLEPHPLLHSLLANHPEWSLSRPVVEIASCLHI
jgi:hypothetical protein